MTTEKLMQEIVSRETLIPLGTAIAIISALFVAYQSLQTRLNNMERKIDRINFSLDDQWTIKHQLVFSNQLKSGNPDLNIPDISDIITSHSNRRDY